MPISVNDQQEWLEVDGLGGFASGTVSGIRTRRYHGLLVSANTPPTGRRMLVNGLEAHVTTAAGTFALSSHRYAGWAVQPDGHRLVTSFQSQPWPTWRYQLPDGTIIEQELFMPHESPAIVLSWRVRGSTGPVRLAVRPLLSGRDYHALHHENEQIDFSATVEGSLVRWRPYTSANQPAVVAHTNGHYAHEPLWYRNFLYQEEWLRGFDATEDLASPGTFDFDLAAAEAVCIFSAAPLQPSLSAEESTFAIARVQALRFAESRHRRQFPTALHRAADQYIVRRGQGKSIIAGYPWFADWGRDTFVSLRGLCLAVGRFEDARLILLQWSNAVSRGMLPNRFSDNGEEPEYNSVDASLWFVVAVHEFERRAKAAGFDVSDSDSRRLHAAVDAILVGFASGTRYGIRLDTDGLLMAGEPGLQLTWMDARVGDRVITPRIGKPVEVEALWLTALCLTAEDVPGWRSLAVRGCSAFRRRFWNEERQCLYDVIDCDHQRGVCDGSLRPNQVFALGGLPLMLIDNGRARRIVDTIEERLWTPMGLRSLAVGEPGYIGRYHGSPAQRDEAYHQGTVWPWLIGPFVEAWLRVRGNTSDARHEARRRFVLPLLEHLDSAGINHVSEIADANAPHMPRGCPFQAWSVAELLWLEEVVLAEPVTSSVSQPLQSRVEHQRLVSETI